LTCCSKKGWADEKSSKQSVIKWAAANRRPKNKDDWHLGSLHNSLTRLDNFILCWGTNRCTMFLAAAAILTFVVSLDPANAAGGSRAILQATEEVLVNSSNNVSRPIVGCDASCDLVSWFFSWGCFAWSRAISWRSQFAMLLVQCYWPKRCTVYWK
jgi:hypothetical protein